MSPTTAAESTFQSFDIQHEVLIEASPARVWDALTTETVEWWPAKFYTGEKPKAFVLEAKVGGRLYEDWGGGAGALFATVTGVYPGKMLQWAGDMPADFGGPARSITTFTLELSDGGNTVLRFRDTPFGKLHPAVEAGLTDGWSWLLNSCFKPFVENGQRPERPNSLVGREERKL